MEEGWIKLYRKFVQWEWYTDANVKSVYLHILLNANHRDGKWRGIEIKRGQLITSINHLAEDLGLSTSQIRTALDKLKMTNEITTKTTNKYTLISIEKYTDYQDCEIENRKQNRNQNNKQIANKSQTNRKQIATNNNEYNNNNEKKEKKDLTFLYDN